MIKQNIKIAIVSIIACLTFWLVVLNFIKIDICSTSLISMVDVVPQIAIESNMGSYIENHAIDKIKMNYQSQYYWCTVSLIKSSDQYYSYSIILPDVVDKTLQYFTTTIIIDEVNVYSYLFKK